MNVEVAELGPERVDDFFALHSEANGAGWCFCVAWWVPAWSGWGDRTAEQNKELRRSLFDQGHYDGYLLYIDGIAAGWCQCGKRDRLAKLNDNFDLAQDPDCYAITCFFLAPQFRGMGLSGKLLDAILKDLKQKGIGKVMGFPQEGRGEDHSEIWTGPESIFEKAGFKKFKHGQRRSVYELKLS